MDGWMDGRRRARPFGVDPAPPNPRRGVIHIRSGPAGSIDNGWIDLGEVVAETLALDLDPYPRKPGEAFPGHVEDDGAEAKAPSPFAVLAPKKGS